VGDECYWFLVIAHTFKRFLQRCRVEERFFDSGTKPFSGSGKRLKSDQQNHKRLKTKPS